MDNVPPFIQTIDPSVLTDVARQAARAPDLALIDWSAAPLTHEKVIETTGGLYRFSGHGRVGSQTISWSAVLKIILRPQDDCLTPSELCYWERELLAYQSGSLSDLPPGLRAPRCYGSSESGQDAWIWLEDVQETVPRTWTLAEFQRAARRLGCFSGAYLAGRPLPSQPWLCPSIFRAFLADGEWWAKFSDPHSPKNAWQRPVVRQIFSEALRSRILKLWADKWEFIAANERLPQVFCHNDAHRRNMMLIAGAGGQEELVAIDWAFCGPGGVGNDLGEFIGTSLSHFEFDPAQAVELETAVLDAYLAGLREAGWSGDDQLVRLGYNISLALWWGATLPCAAAIELEGPNLNVEAKYGRPLEAVKPGWTLLSEFALDRADQARLWMRGLA